MKTILATILFAGSLFAQDQSSITAAMSACGDAEAKFDVKTDATQHSLAQPESGKALVYVIEDAGRENLKIAGPTVKVGLDGAWVGANHRASYFSFAVAPGEHHLCANWQSIMGSLSKLVTLAHFTAEPGKPYYFRTRIVSAGQISLDLDPLDSDQGKLLIATYPLSIPQPKK